jgi:TDG/mug DNA glycosylase family protein
MTDSPPDSGPTKQELAAAEGNGVPDVIRDGLRILFCGINPGLYSGTVGHHFARPGNRFWKALSGAGLTTRTLDPEEEKALLGYGYGVTNLVNSATAAASDLDRRELVEGGRRLAEKVGNYAPETVAILGIGAYRTAYGRRDAEVGRQDEGLAGASLWVLPSPSGRNAHYRLSDLVELFEALRRDVWRDGPEDCSGGG